MDNPFGYWFGILTGAASLGIPLLLVKLINWSSEWAGWKAGTDSRLRQLEERLDRLEGKARRSRESEL
jgi:hypothetical protein